MGDENPPHTLRDYSRLGMSTVRTAKLRNDILTFQQHQGESLSEAWTRFKDLLQKVPHHVIDLWLQVQIFYDHVNPVMRRTINQSAGGKLHDKNVEESWALIEDLTLFDNESWNDPRDFAKPVKAISLPQYVSRISDHHLIELENQVQRLIEAHLTPNLPVQVNKIAFSCEIRSGPHDTQYCMKDPEQALLIMHHRVSMKRETSGLVSNFMASQDARLSKFEADFKQQQSEMTNKIDTFLKAINDRMTGALPSDTVKNPKLNVNPTSSVSSAHSYLMEDP
ncbi:MAK10-like protein [Tanacetum coccineum]|uniref:MAK10-like protein n=1 Tax=Tanacetum coccineum TaxID=301880 RepID=A0ABQ5ERM4_9ASTR